MPDVVNVQHTRGGSSGIDATPLSNGQILYDHEAKRIFLDVIVDEELVRIAMKEGIFTGTELEWNALTDAQKAVFTYVNITDDYEFHSDVFVGATASTDGQVGLVTRPMAGDEGKYLKGDGTWEEVPSFSGDYNDLTNKPDLKTVATSGSYNDLTDKPTIPAGTVTSVATGAGLTGGPITSSGTIALEGNVVTAGSAGPTAAVTGNDGTTVAIPRITVDTYGRVTGLTSYDLTNKNTTYSSKTAASGGTDTSLVTTGEKYTWNNKSTVTIGNTGTASSTVVSYQRVGINGTYTAVKGTMYMQINNTSSTSYAFTNSNITTSSTIDVYTDTFGDSPSNVSISNNTCTVTFSAAKTRSVKIYIK